MRFGFKFWAILLIAAFVSGIVIMGVIEMIMG